MSTEPSVVPTPCCAPVTGVDALSVSEAEQLARMFKALSDPTRLRLLSLIATAPGEQACICDLTGPVGLSQPTVSHHMRQLSDAGLVERRQRGKWAHFRVVESTLDALGRAVRPHPGRT